MNASYTAARMLGITINEMDVTLDNLIADAEKLVEADGGQLVSRQAIACLILQWEAQTGLSAKTLAKEKEDGE